VITKAQQAGELYSAGRKAVRDGGLELHSLARHLILMIDGTNEFKEPLWPIRELSDGRVIELDYFIDYLLKPAREGLHLPSLYFLKQTLEATTPVDAGATALARVRATLASEDIDFDAQARLDEMKLHGERPAAMPKGRPPKIKRDNVPFKSSRGNSASHLATRIKRERPDISERLAKGEFKSVRAAAIEAGIITPPTPLEQMQKLWAKLDAANRMAFTEWAGLKPP